MSYVKYLQCAGFGARVEDDRLWNVCTVCGKPLIAIYDLKKIRKKITRDAIKSRPPDLWRFRELLPVEDPDGNAVLISSDIATLTGASPT